MAALRQSRHAELLSPSNNSLIHFRNQAETVERLSWDRLFDVPGVLLDTSGQTASGDYGAVREGGLFDYPFNDIIHLADCARKTAPT